MRGLHREWSPLFNLLTGERNEMTQAQQILKTLQDGFTVTALDALRDFQCFRLSARILELKDEGWPIAKKMVKVKSGKKIASYYLEFENA